MITETPTIAPKMSLKAIQNPVAQELKQFQQHFKDALQTDVSLLDWVSQYMLKRKGKQMRPLLVMLSAKLNGQIGDSTYHAAALVELLHTATLTHDDIVDGAERRRGVFSIFGLWKTKIAVLFGDYLLSQGLLLALRHKEYDLLHIVSDAVRRMSEGELLQIQKSRHLDIDEETYFRIISDKTASLISACTAAGASSVTQDQKVIDTMHEMGEKLGLAFQIKDDLFDFGVDDVGKPLGIDLQEKKLTLPLIYALRTADKADRKRIMKIIRKNKKSRTDIRVVSDFVTAVGGIQYAKDKMYSLAEEAKTLILSLPAETNQIEARDAMLALVDFVIVRTK